MFSLFRSHPLRTLSVSSTALVTRLGRFSTSSIDDVSDPVFSNTRTNTTAQLWKKRVQKDLLDEAKKESLLKEKNPNLPSFIVSKSPTESLVSVDVNFGSQPSLRSQYQSWKNNSVRFGKILEDLDALAGNIAHTHADDNNPNTRPLHIVTACVDRIDALAHFPIDKDLTMYGCVGYVGSSSMHIHVDIAEKEKPENIILTSSFLMVARDISTGKSTPVNTLSIHSDEEKRRWVEGEEAKKIRKVERTASLLTSLPTPKELLQIHSVHFPSKDQSPQSCVPMSETVMTSVTVTQPQERNTKDKIFGGYLMRKAYELGMATALEFLGPKSNPFLLSVDEITFHRAVEVGSIITFRAVVIFTTKKACQMKVETLIHDLVKDVKHKSNTFYFSFATQSDEPIPQVKPITYEESMDYVDGSRRYESSKEAATRQNSTLLSHYE